MPRHASFSSRLHRSDRRVSYARGVPDRARPQPGSDGGDVDDCGNIDAYVYVDVYVNANGNVNENANANGVVGLDLRANGIGNANANGVVYVDLSANGIRNAHTNGNTDVHACPDRHEHLPALPHPISGCPIVCSCRRVGCAAN